MTKFKVFLGLLAVGLLLQNRIEVIPIGAIALLVWETPRRYLSTAVHRITERNTR